MKVQSHVRSDRALEDRFIAKSRLDLNDLIKRRQLEKKKWSKNQSTNFFWSIGNSSSSIYNSYLVKI